MHEEWVVQDSHGSGGGFISLQYMRVDFFSLLPTAVNWSNDFKKRESNQLLSTSQNTIVHRGTFTGPVGDEGDKGTSK